MPMGPLPRDGVRDNAITRRLYTRPTSRRALHADRTSALRLGSPRRNQSCELTTNIDISGTLQGDHPRQGVGEDFGG